MKCWAHQSQGIWWEFTSNFCSSKTDLFRKSIKVLDNGCWPSLKIFTAKTAHDVSIFYFSKQKFNVQIFSLKSLFWNLSFLQIGPKPFPSTSQILARIWCFPRHNFDELQKTYYSHSFVRRKIYGLGDQQWNFKISKLVVKA